MIAVQLLVSTERAQQIDKSICVEHVISISWKLPWLPIWYHSQFKELVLPDTYKSLDGQRPRYLEDHFLLHREFARLLHWLREALLRLPSMVEWPPQGETDLFHCGALAVEHPCLQNCGGLWLCILFESV